MYPLWSLSPCLVLAKEFSAAEFGLYLRVMHSICKKGATINFIVYIQMSEGLIMGDALLKFMLYKELVRVVKVSGCLNCSKCKMVDFRILGGDSRIYSKISNLNFERADFSLLCYGMWS